MYVIIPVDFSLQLSYYSFVFRPVQNNIQLNFHFQVKIRKVEWITAFHVQLKRKSWNFVNLLLWFGQKKPLIQTSESNKKVLSVKDESSQAQKSYTVRFRRNAYKFSKHWLKCPTGSIIVQFNVSEGSSVFSICYLLLA